MSKYTKLSIAFLAAVTCFSSQVFAEEMQNNRKPSEPGYGRDHRVPPAQPLGSTDDNLNFFVGASYTFWLPYNSALGVAFGNGTVDSTGNTLSPPTNGCSGFKVAAGANIDHDGWHVRANYTWFLNNPGTHTAGNVNGDEYGYLVYGSTTPENLEYFKSRYYVFFNRIDACINRNYFIGEYVAFRPWLGLLGAWDSQFVKDRYKSLNSDPVTNMKFDQDWWGVGPYAGGEATYFFTQNIGLYIQSGVSMLYANHKTNLQNNANDGFFGSNNKDSFNNVEPMLEAALGLRWEMMFDGFAFRLDLAWEMQTYLEHISFPVYLNSVQNFVNYSMQGLTVSARFSF